MTFKLNMEQQNVENALNSLLTDITNLRTAVGGHKTEFDKIITDFTSVRTQLVAEIADRAAVKVKFDLLLADVTAIHTKFGTLTAKLDLDAGVTDANYAATCNPAAISSAAVPAPTAVNPSAISVGNPAAAAALVSEAGT